MYGDNQQPLPTPPDKQEKNFTPRPHAPILHYPGAHCGLFEAAILAPYFPSSLTLVAGPASCLYHAKLLHARRRMGPDNLHLLLLEEKEMVFGLEAVIGDVLCRLDQRYRPELIFLITTCTPEIIGFDHQALLQEQGARLQAKLLVVDTNGFSRLHRQEGTRSFLSALLPAMKASSMQPGSVNLLGLRLPHWQETELAWVLSRSRILVNTALPGAASLAEITRAPAASLNIVTSEAALALAEGMKSQFGTPYVVFGQPYFTENIVAAYREIEESLDMSLEPAVTELAQVHRQALAVKEKALAGTTFAMGVYDGSSWEAAAFLASLGLRPIFLQTWERLTPGHPYAHKLAALGYPIPVGFPGNVRELQALLKEHSPQVYLGHGLTEMMAQLGVAQCHPGISQKGPGFAAVEQRLDDILMALHNTPRRCC